MARYYHPDEFADLKQVALDLGFVHVESGPLVRSSYHAHETANAYSSKFQVASSKSSSQVASRKSRPLLEGGAAVFFLVSNDVEVTPCHTSAPS